MRRFIFSLESVLTIRKKALEDARVQLAGIINVLNKQNEVLAQMLDALDNLRQESEKYLGAVEFNPGIIANYSAFSNKIVQDIKTQEEIIKKTKIALQKQQELTKDAYIKVKSLENLKEKQKEQYDKEVQQEEFKLIDDIVNSRIMTA